MFIIDDQYSTYKALKIRIMESMKTNIIPDSIEVDKIEINKLSVNKFVILSIVTLGLYELWWIFKSWRFFQDKEKSDIMPAIRTVFSIFYLIPLFNKILNLAKNNGYKHSYVSVFLFVGFLAANLLVLLPSLFFLTAIISFVFLIPPFKALNFAVNYCEGFTVIEQSAFSKRQIFLLIIGVILWILVIVSIIPKDTLI
jgi:hypothetical protein